MRLSCSGICNELPRAFERIHDGELDALASKERSAGPGRDL
jgi:hypothetical protein